MVVRSRIGVISKMIVGVDKGFQKKLMVEPENVLR